jgi:hypothetical protein
MDGEALKPFADEFDNQAAVLLFGVNPMNGLLRFGRSSLSRSGSLHFRIFHWLRENAIGTNAETPSAEFVWLHFHAVGIRRFGLLELTRPAVESCAHKNPLGRISL